MYRQGATGALLDIYEQAISELKTTIENIPDDMLIAVIDTHTSDENCRSFQSVLSHVVHAGFGYATSIGNYKGDNQIRPDKTFRTTVGEYATDLKDVFMYTENILSQIKNDELEQTDNALKIKTGWGQWYDIEQLMEHAIVHILRHKRQIERWKQTVLT